MSGPTHTPGPWDVRTRHVSGYNGETPYTKVTLFVQSSNGLVCQLLQDGDEPDPATRADARLLAAAPELLQALEDCLEQLAAYHEGDWLGASWGPRVGLPAAIEAARAAIGKAQGQPVRGTSFVEVARQAVGEALAEAAASSGAHSEGRPESRDVSAQTVPATVPESVVPAAHFPPSSGGQE